MQVGKMGRSDRRQYRKLLEVGSEFRADVGGDVRITVYDDHPELLTMVKVDHGSFVLTRVFTSDKNLADVFKQARKFLETEMAGAGV